MAINEWLEREPFSCVDAAWLKMEDPTNLMMINGIFTLDQPLSHQDLSTLVEKRLVKRYARFRQLVEMPLTTMGYPQWRRDPHFDLSAHVRRIGLPGAGDEQALKDMVSDLMSTPLDYTKPLWQLHLVENYRGGSAIIARLHHCIGDGVALVRVLLSLTDELPGADWSGEPGPPVQLEQGWGTWEALAGPAKRAWHEGVRLVEDALAEGRQTLAHPRRAWAGAKLAAAGAAILGQLATMPSDPPSAFKGELGIRKRAAWSRPIPLSEIKLIGCARGGTINDILLSSVAGALRRYLIGRGENVDGLDLRAVVPVNLRPLTEEITLGNQFGLVFVPLPVGIASPCERLEELKRRMDAIKQSPEAAATLVALGLFGLLPLALNRPAIELFGRKATGVMTNVPGPRHPLFFAGRKIDTVMFWVPQSARLGLGVSILSYAGDVRIGIATDVRLVPEPEVVVRAFEDEVRELNAAAAAGGSGA